MVAMYLLVADITINPVVVAWRLNTQYTAHRDDTKDLSISFYKGILH